MIFGVGMRVREIAGCRNDFKTSKERRGIVCFSQVARVRAVSGESKLCPGISGTQSFDCIALCALVSVKPLCRDFSDKQPIQTLNLQTQRNLF